ncbi:MAG: nickel pincer cofactor biosynthesis protein LarC [Candidatus Saccharibacteria bacterium]
MQVLYFDCFSGISGDMTLGALVDLGADIRHINDFIDNIFQFDLSLTSAKKLVNHISATDIKIEFPEHQHFHNFSKISEKILKSDLLTNDKDSIINIFNRIANAEAKIHGIDVDQVHFHEIGAVDTVVDVVGTVLALRQLDISRCYSSPIPLARGLKKMHHGVYPLPAPATLSLLNNASCYGTDSDIELVTPTGAALITSLTTYFDVIPQMKVDSIGYGAGKYMRDDIPNVLRVIKGSINENSLDKIGVIETNIDDMNPEIFSYLFEAFYDLKGAIDISVSNIINKKNRPAFKIECLVFPESITDISNWLISNTTTLGVRTRVETRICVEREVNSLTTQFGNIKVKSWIDSAGRARFAPEYEECRRIAIEQKLPIVLVYNEINRHFDS